MTLEAVKNICGGQTNFNIILNELGENRCINIKLWVPDLPGGLAEKRNKKGLFQGKYLSKENLKITTIFGSYLPVNEFYIELRVTLNKLDALSDLLRCDRCTSVE